MNKIMAGLTVLWLAAIEFVGQVIAKCARDECLNNPYFYGECSSHFIAGLMPAVILTFPIYIVLVFIVEASYRLYGMVKRHYR